MRAAAARLLILGLAHADFEVLARLAVENHRLAIGMAESLLHQAAGVRQEEAGDSRQACGAGVLGRPKRE